MTGRADNPYTLASDRAALTVDPAFGARILTLTDLASDRQWLLEGPRARDVSEATVFLGEASRGWDECFPTVLSCRYDVWGGRLRDHGMLWGRPWDVTDAGPRHLETVFRADGIRFARRLSLEGAEITADYTVTSERDAAVPYLWSQHCVLNPRDGDRIVLSGQGEMQAEGAHFDWPMYRGRDLSGVGGADEGFVLKAYAPTPGAATAALVGRDGGLRFHWTGSEVPALGLWLDYGGWPEGAPLRQVAIEPTTGAADDLAGAEALDQARRLAPGEVHRWSVGLTLLDANKGDIQ